MLISLNECKSCCITCPGTTALQGYLVSPNESLTAITDETQPDCRIAFWKRPCRSHAIPCLRSSFTAGSKPSFFPFSLGQPISRSCPKTGSCEKLCPVETLDYGKGFLGGEGAAACSMGCTEAPFQESSLHRVGEMQIFRLRVKCQLPLGAWSGPSVPSC